MLMENGISLKEKVTYFLLNSNLIGNDTVEIRGKGLMFAIDFMCEEIAEAVYNDLIESGFIVCNRGAFLRIDPPLTIGDNEFSQFINELTRILEALDIHIIRPINIDTLRLFSAGCHERI